MVGAALAVPTDVVPRSGLLVRVSRIMCACAAAAAGVIVMTAGPISAQVAPRPSLNGVWERYPDPVTSDADVFGDLEPPEGGPVLREPYASQWKAVRARRAAAAAAGRPLVDESTRCLPEGMPLIMGAIFPIQFLETPGQVTVLAEFLTQTRRIYLDAQVPTAEDFAPSFYGFSVGSWTNDTLVVVTRHVRRDVLFFEIPHSEEMTITEHIRLVSPDLIENRVEIDDPAYLAQPYKFVFGYKRSHDYRIMEYFCDESKDKIEDDSSVSLDVN